MARFYVPFFTEEILENFKEIDFKKSLNPEQYEAVGSSPDEPMLVLAGAGSGKTRTLTYRVAWLISECKILPREILLLTFTNKAAREMLNRIETLTGRSAGEFWGGTFHSVAGRFLRIDAHKIGLNQDFAIIDSEDAAKLIKQSTEEIFPTFFDNKDNPRQKLLNDIISYSRNTMLNISDALYKRFSWLTTPVDEIEAIAEAFEEKKRNINVCDFDDLLELWYKLLRDNPDVLQKYLRRFKNILVDEYQDTNTLQGKILDLLASHGKISAVGDQSQCIYSWRGANIENILRFQAQFKGAKIFKVEQNYRSTPEILDFANQIIERADEAETYKKNLVSVRSSGVKPIVMRSPDTMTQSMRILDCIKNITERYDSKYDYKDIAILYRSHSQSRDMELRLQKYSVPFSIISGVKFFAQAHIKDLVAQLRFVANQKDIISFMRVLCFMPKLGEKTAQKIYLEAEKISEKTCRSLVEVLEEKSVLSKVPKASKDVFAAFAKDAKKLEEMLKTSRALSAEKLFDKLDAPVQGTLFDEDKKSEKVVEENCRPQDMISLIAQSWYLDSMKVEYEDWEERAEDFNSLYDYAAGYKNFDDFLTNAALEIDGGKSDDGANTNRVRMMTVHQAKGLEFPVVFILGASEGLFPIKRSIEEGDVEEERRLFYVASTRAENILVVSYPQLHVQSGSYEPLEISRFVLDVNRDCYETNY